MPIWKKGRGKLGALAPLLGTWRTEADSPMGPTTVVRELAPALDGAYVALRADWVVGGKPYHEVAYFGVDDDGVLGFWSFTSDGKRSHGRLCVAPDVHPEAIAFEVEVPAGIARQVYWPGEDGAVMWAVESRTKKGWNRFLLHRYAKVG
jgi:hypothetical protein